MSVLFKSLLFNKSRKLLKGNRGTVVKTLNLVAILVSKKLNLLVSFSTLGYNQHAQAMGHFDNHGAYSGLLFVSGHVAHKVGVDLKGRNWQLSEVRELGKSGAKIIQGE